MGWVACGMRQKSEKGVGGGDDTAVNAVQFLYCHLNSSARRWGAAQDGKWGTWDAPAVCPAGTYMNHLVMKFEKGQGSGDDTAANRFSFRCRAPTTGGQGGWIYPAH